MKMEIIEAIKKVKKGKKRNFTQAIDLIIALSNFDIKSGNKLEEFFSLPVKTGPKKICAFVGLELKSQAQKICDKVIAEPEFSKWSSKKDCKKLARDYDYFIAQANIMPAVAKTFGKYLGVVGKMPNPKAGQIIPPNAKLDIIVPKMKNLTKIKVSKNPVINCKIGNENTPDQDLIKNAEYVIDHLIQKLPQGKSNIKKVLIRTTMGKPEVVKL